MRQGNARSEVATAAGLGCAEGGVLPPGGGAVDADAPVPPGPWRFGAPSGEAFACDASVLIVKADAEAVSGARTFVARWLTDHGYPAAVRDDALVVAAELLSNAYLHTAGPDILVRVFGCAAGPVIEIWDTADDLPEPARPDDTAESGRGLTIVAALARAWGTARHPTTGKAVWALITHDPSKAG
ncbi:ATP-binding protein [Actinomadura atramentaria]|uniref:ATP-binding protein n=1 Tax=Actinomadura atramentaria TaxID=1990 RepID=UPI0003711567|nr:ATP-binding protein [Actinomadura atramentaria]